jgi:hypothetical protein
MTEQGAAEEVAGKRLAESLWWPQQVAEFLGVTTSTLDQWRSRGKGPRYYKVGKHARYDPYDLRLFLLSKASDASDEEAPRSAAAIGTPVRYRARRRGARSA